MQVLVRDNKCRTSPQGAEEKAAARGPLPGDESATRLRKAVRETKQGKGGSRAAFPETRSKAGAKGRAAACTEEESASNKAFAPASVIYVR